MKSLKITGLIFFLLSSSLCAQNDLGDKEQEVINAQAARFSAMIQADDEKLDKLLSDDLSYSHTTGWTETKAEFLSTVNSGKLNYLSMSSKDLNVRIYGNLAVLTGLADVKIIHSRGQAEFTIRFLEVQRKSDTTWQLIAWQSVKNVVD